MKAADLTGILWTRLASPPTKNQRSGHAEMAMRHNWLAIVVYLGPSAHIQLGAGAAPPVQSLAASAKNSVRKFVRQNATPALRLH